MAGKWKVEGDNVTRAGVVVARISAEAGKWRWDGVTFDMQRSGFDNREEILEDVKYFHRNQQMPKLAITFKSGRKLVLR